MIAAFIGVAGISALIGMGVGALAEKHCYKCEHQWEKIIDERLEGTNANTGSKYILHTTVHMCKKCGKRKVMKV